MIWMHRQSIVVYISFYSEKCDLNIKKISEFVIFEGKLKEMNEIQPGSD